MKILNVETHPATVLGRECDRCHYRVEMGVAGGRCLHQSDLPSDVQQGAMMARFIAVDLDHGHSLGRADLCPRCANELLDSIRVFLPHLRTIARRRGGPGGNGMWHYDYQAIDASTGSMFSASSIFDEGA